MPADKGPLESVIVTQILKYLRSLPDCYAIKTHGSQFSVVGTPDILGAINGAPLVLEVKRPGNRPTPAQEHQMALWLRAGSVVAVVHSVEEVADFLRGLGF